MGTAGEVVYLVDDDWRIREAVSELLSTFDMQVIAFSTASEYLAHPKPECPACLLLDVELPDINGLELQRQIAAGDDAGIVFITGHGDIPSSVRAIKTGAVDFLTKPFTEEDLLAAIRPRLPTAVPHTGRRRSSQVCSNDFQH